jgi:periplasmic protein CpxP/Spy
MKRFIAGMMAWTLCTAPAAWANEGHEMNVDKKVEKLKNELALTPDQESQVKAVLNEYKDKAKALKDEKKAKMDAILTPDQKSKHEKMMKEWKEKRKDKHDDDDKE